VQELADHRALMARAEAERDYIEHAVEELRALDPQPDEEKKLAGARQIMMHAEQYSAALSEVESVLSGDGVEARLNAALRKLERRKETAGGRLDLVCAALERVLVEQNEAGRAIAEARRLFDFANGNPTLKMRASSYTHSDAVLCAIPGMVTLNSALEVDLTGQVNSEQTGDSYVGGTGGQIDYVRAGSRSRGGHSLIALPSTAAGGKLSRIVASLTGPVSTARSEVDVVITEYGAAELKGRSIAERAKRLVNIAHPAFRENLERNAFAFEARGY